MCRILLVENECLEREALKKIIYDNIKGVSIVGETENGRVAVKMCEELKPDIIFMDIKISGISGLDASKIIRNKNRDVIIVFLTAYLEDEIIQNCIRAGGNEYILKPFRPEKIINFVNKYIDKVKNNKDFLTTMKKELVSFIIEEDYRSSKKILNELIDNLQVIHSEGIEEFKLSCKEVVGNIIGAFDTLNLKINTRKLDHIKFFKQVPPLVDYYLIKRWVFEVLDVVFEIIIDKKKTSDDNKLKVALNYIEKNYLKKITLNEVAEYINFSPFYLSKQFKKELGINFVDYVTKLKMEKAKELLANTNMPIINIAIELSYNEQNYFSRVFKKHFKITPSEYRDGIYGLE